MWLLMDRAQGLKRNLSLLFWIYGLRNLKSLNAVITLFYLHRGVTIDQAFYLGIVWSVATLVVEVPSGWLADRFGRKRTMMLGMFLLVCAAVATFFAQGFTAFVGVFLIMSAADSCFSGTEEATLYDTLKERGEEKDATRHNARISSANNWFKLIVPTLGAFVAKDLLEWQFDILIGIDLVAVIVGMFVILALIEPKHEADVSAVEAGIFRESWHVLLRDPFLFRAALNKILIFIVGFIIWRQYQPFLLEHGFTVFWLGVVYLMWHFSSLVIKRWIGAIEDRIGPTRILTWTVIGMIVFSGIAFVAEAAWLAGLALWLAEMLEIARGPVFVHAINRRMPSHSRATTLSQLSVIKAFIDIPVLLLSGYLASKSLDYVFIVAIAICVFVLAAFPIRKRDLDVPAFGEELPTAHEL